MISVKYRALFRKIYDLRSPAVDRIRGAVTRDSEKKNHPRSIAPGSEKKESRQNAEDMCGNDVTRRPSTSQKPKTSLW